MRLTPTLTAANALFLLAIASSSSCGGSSSVNMGTEVGAGGSTSDGGLTGAGGSTSGGFLPPMRR